LLAKSIGVLIRSRLVRDQKRGALFGVIQGMPGERGVIWLALILLGFG